MIRIDTDVPEIIVEIEDKEYPVAPRNIEIMEKLAEAERSNLGKPIYRLWMAELEILLGKDACRELFIAGRAENVDRIQLIYTGVAKAFQYTANAVAERKREKDMDDVATALAPLNEFMRHVRAMDNEDDNPSGGKIRTIRRK